MYCDSRGSGKSKPCLVQKSPPSLFNNWFGNKCLFTRAMSFRISDSSHQKMFNFKIMTEFLKDVIFFFLHEEALRNELSSHWLCGQSLCPQAWAEADCKAPRVEGEGHLCCPPHGVFLVCRWHLQPGLMVPAPRELNEITKAESLDRCSSFILKISIITVPLAQNADCGRPMLPE